jgi:hypothetical protein
MTFPDHLIVPASDLAGQRTVILKVEDHLLVLRLLAGLAIVKP